MSTGYRFAILLAEDVPPGKAMNLAAHLSAQFGAANPAVAGPPVTDATGARYSGLPTCPNLILSAARTRLRELWAQVRAGAAVDQIQVFEFLEEGFATATDEEYRAAVREAQPSRIEVHGLLLYGPRKALSRYTNGLNLYGKEGPR